jgi:hypothetical protein
VEETRKRLLAQHERLRDLLDRVLVFADHFLADKPVAEDLGLALAELRIAFTAHNELEQSLLEPLLQATGTWGPARIERMREEHAAEHAAFVAFLGQPLEVLARNVVDFVEDLEAHMQAEERTFLHRAVTKDLGPPPAG